MNEHQQRQEAIRRYLGGEKIARIARLMKKSRKWVHHWVNRYKAKPDSTDWYQALSAKIQKVLPMWC